MEIQVINSQHFNMATESHSVLSPRSRRAYKGAANSVKLDMDDNRLAAISTGTTSYLPLIGLPKKKVDFNPNQSVIQPLSIHDELWLNLGAEITRRKSTSSDTVEEIIVHQPTVVSAEAGVSSERPGRMVRIQRHFKKALTRLRKVFHQPSDDVTTYNNESPNPPLRVAPDRQRSVVRRDSNVTNAKRLAAKRKRPAVMDDELADSHGLLIQPHQFQSQQHNLSDECEPDNSEITSELLEIFEHLTVSVSKRPRLDSIQPYVSRIRSC